MKKILLLIAVLGLFATAAYAQQNMSAYEFQYVDARTLGLYGKGLEGGSEPYYRADPKAYSFNKVEALLMSFPSGMFVAFRTNSTILGIQMTSGAMASETTTSTLGKSCFDLYVRDGRKWEYAATRIAGKAGEPAYGLDRENAPVIVRRNMPEGEKEFILYLPLFMQIKELKIGVAPGTYIEAIENPFRKRIVLCGSSVCHGVGASRAGTGWSSKVSRDTGLYIMNYSLSGNCTMQRHVGQMIADIPNVDAFILDTFNNPTMEKIEKNFDGFVAAIRAKYPTTPLIFLSNHRRDCGNFDTSYRKFERYKFNVVEKKVEKLAENDPNVYFVDIFDITGEDGYAQSDGVHPDGLGYYRWAENITPIIMNILKKYKIK